MLVGLAVLVVLTEPFEHFVRWSAAHENLEVDEVLVFLAASHVVMSVFGARRARDLKREFAQRRQAERDLAFQARHDALTGLPNRTAFAEVAAAAIGTDEHRGGVAVMLIDLDRFKEVNDTLGHHTGDALLQQVASRLQDTVAAGATVSRLGGDEFGVVLPASASATREAAALVAALRRPFAVAGLTLEVEASVGIARCPEHGRDAGLLLQRADVAMYTAKAERTDVAVYEPRLDEHTPARLALFGELRRAIGSEELVLHYQPRATVRGSRVTGVEALVRWQHPTRGLLGPAEFLDVAEQTGLIRPLTTRVLSLALADCRAWRDEGLDLTVGVNLSPRSLLDGSFPDEVARLLSSYDLDPRLLELEITEGTIMTDPGRALRNLERLHTLGVGLSVDDYGTGHSSLAYLSRLPVSTLKIDRSFVQHMDVDAGNATIVRSTIELGRNLGLRVVAEGVETVEVWRRLQDLGCDEAQGFWLARPGPPAGIAEHVRELERRVAVPAPLVAAPRKARD